MTIPDSDIGAVREIEKLLPTEGDIGYGEIEIVIDEFATCGHGTEVTPIVEGHDWHDVIENQGDVHSLDIDGYVITADYAVDWPDGFGDAVDSLSDPVYVLGWETGTKITVSDDAPDYHAHVPGSPSVGCHDSDTPIPDEHRTLENVLK